MAIELVKYTKVLIYGVYAELLLLPKCTKI